MPKNKAFQRRIQILDQCLRRRQRVWTVNSLLEATNEHLANNGCPEISQRTLYDDLRYLQETLNAPVEKFQQGKSVCYRYCDPAYTLVNTPLSWEEKELLQKMLDFLRANNLPMQSEIADLLNRHGLLTEISVTSYSIRKLNVEPPYLKESEHELKSMPDIQKSILLDPSNPYSPFSNKRKAESPPAAPQPSPAASPRKAVSPELTLLNRLVLRMELEDYATYRESFWKWLESA